MLYVVEEEITLTDLFRTVTNDYVHGGNFLIHFLLCKNSDKSDMPLQLQP